MEELTDTKETESFAEAAARHASRKVIERERWHRNEQGVLTVVCECGTATPLNDHHAKLDGTITPHFECKHCNEESYITLAEFQGGVIN